MSGKYLDGEILKRLSEKVHMRTADVVCNELKSWYPGDNKKVFVDESGDESDLVIKVRGLNGIELYKYRNIVPEENRIIVNGLLESLRIQDVPGVGEAMNRLSGNYEDEDVPIELIKTRQCLELGSVKPKIGKWEAYHLSVQHPIVFERLTNMILELTGLGAELKKKPKLDTP